MSTSPTRRLLSDYVDLHDPRGRAGVAARTFVILYLSVLIFLVTFQFLAATGERVPVLQRLLPSAAYGLWEIPMGIGVGVAIVLLQLALRPFMPWIRAFDETMFGLIGKPNVWHCLAIAATSALTEEVAFRGMLQVSTHIVLASILFGLAHYLMWQWAVFATVMGFVFGGLFILTDGGLLAPILAHFTVNFLGLLQISRDCPDDAPPLNPDHPVADPEGENDAGDDLADTPAEDETRAEDATDRAR